MTNATVDNIASTFERCGLVIFDSHGTTDYSGSNSDYTSRANSSYLCLTTNSGVTSTDTASKTGSYGTYSDAITGSGYAYVNGQCIANHMSSNAPHSMLYMGICLGMATDRMCAPLRAKGVEVVYGYSQSVSFKGELKSIQSIMGYIQDGMEAGAAIEQSQTDLGCQWDPAYPSYTESQAKSNKVAFPVVASSEDTYPGHGNVDCVLTALCAAIQEGLEERKLEKDKEAATEGEAAKPAEGKTLRSRKGAKKEEPKAEEEAAPAAEPVEAPAAETVEQ
jgi:hypothetical protein